jgi:cytochrome c biogenesis protein CcmG, thiol:disulfide interchange protein DsbE
MGHRKTGSGNAARVALSVVLVAGLSLAAVLTRHHENKLYGDATAILSNCPETETVNCDTVNTSAWSELLGVPIAAFALPTYALVLLLLWRSRTAPPLLDYAFCIGLLTTLYSIFLLYVSSTRIGFICLYCMGLYGVNVSIPILTALAARRPPLSLLGRTLSDLLVWPRMLRFTAVTFLALLAATIGVQQAYRAHVKALAAAEQERLEEEGGPLVPAGPASRVFPPARSAPDLFFSEAMAAGTAPATAGAYALAGPLRRIEKGSKITPFDLQGRLGHGRPVALLFWAPGFRESERLLITMAGFLRAQLPAFDVYAVAGRNDNERDEEVLEVATMLGVPEDLPLLIDPGFAVSSALNTADVPNVALFDGGGRLIASRIKSAGQKLALPNGALTAEEAMRKLASGAEVPVIQQMAQYYPATELYGECAPQFAAKKFDSDELTTFAGRPESDRPLLLVFWSSTCKHCQVEIPLLVSWLRKNPGRLDVVSVTRIKNEKPGGVSHRDITRGYIRAQGITWPVLEDPDGAITELYRSISTPTSYFITPKGAVVNAWFYPHPANFDKAMEEALAKVKAMSGNSCRPPRDTPAPHLALDMLDPGGKRVTLASQLDRPAIVHLWATWCAPCIEEIPALLQFGAGLEKSGAGRLVMISVEDADSGDRIAGFAKKLGLPLRSNRTPGGALAGMLDLSYRLPRTWLVAPNGVLVGSRQGSQKWDDPQVAERMLSRLRNAAALAH